MRLRNHTLASTCLLAFGAVTAHADGLVTMNGSACKPQKAEDVLKVEYYRVGIASRSSEFISIVCPITNSWGGGTDIPYQLRDMQVFFRSPADVNPIREPVCTLERTEDYGDTLEEQQSEAIVKSAMEPTLWVVTLATGEKKFQAKRSNTEHHYGLTCSLPKYWELRNIKYTIQACKVPTDPKCVQ